MSYYPNLTILPLWGHTYSHAKNQARGTDFTLRKSRRAAPPLLLRYVTTRMCRVFRSKSEWDTGPFIACLSDFTWNFYTFSPASHNQPFLITPERGRKWEKGHLTNDASSRARRNVLYMLTEPIIAKSLPSSLCGNKALDLPVWRGRCPNRRTVLSDWDCLIQ